MNLTSKCGGEIVIAKITDEETTVASSVADLFVTSTSFLLSVDLSTDQ